MFSLCRISQRPSIPTASKAVSRQMHSASIGPPPQTLIEEERLEDFSEASYKFYPVKIGQTLKGRYRVVGKLGFGSTSTVWLARDERSSDYVTLKIHREGPSNRWRESQILKAISSVKTDHAGRKFLRGSLDVFELTAPSGSNHHCLVHQPLWTSIWQLQRQNPSHRYPESLLRGLLKCILPALDFLHTECKLIHTDIKASNILVSISDHSILHDFDEAEQLHPSPCKMDGESIVYQSRRLKNPRVYGHPVLCDLGEAQDGSIPHDDDIQPEVYRAPEVILEQNWSYSVDMWNLGVMIWDLFEDKHLFNGINPTSGEYSNRYHLAEMVALLGPPPPAYLEQNMTDEVHGHFTDSCEWNGSIAIPDLSLEGLEENLQGEKQALFLDFLRSILRWDPKTRLSARELLEHPWMHSS